MPSAQFDSSLEDSLIKEPNIRGGNIKARTRCTQPLKYSGSLDSYKYHDSTPVIGREFQGLQVKDLLQASNSDQLIKDLAVISMPTFHVENEYTINIHQSPNAALSSSETKM